MSPQNQSRSRPPLKWVLSAGVVVTLIVAYAEWAVIPDSAVWVLYLVPVGFVAWYANWLWGAGLALVSLAPAAILVRNAEGGTDLMLRLAVTAGVLYFTHEGRKIALRSSESLRTDPSTGLANARALFDLVATERDRAERYGRPFTLAYVGIDNLPAVRLRSGSAAVEEILRKVALQIRASIRSVDHVARLRDREFALLLPETDADAAAIVVGRVRSVLNETLDGDQHGLAFSVGVVTWHSSDLSAEALHQRTYQLMYAARQAPEPIRHEILEQAVEVGSAPAQRRRGY